MHGAAEEFVAGSAHRYTLQCVHGRVLFDLQELDLLLEKGILLLEFLFDSLEEACFLLRGLDHAALLFQKLLVELFKCRMTLL